MASGKEKECCRWERVTCHPISSHVTELDLGFSYNDDYSEWIDSHPRGISLNATLFLALRQLRSLSLSGLRIYNCTDDAGFESWSNLTELQVLDLSYNELPQSIISSLSKVSSLRTLYLDYNFQMGDRINDISVQELSALNLEVVSLRYCHLNGSSLNLGHWSSLKALSLVFNSLDDTLSLEGLCRLKNLEELDLSSNSFTGILPPCFGNLSSLKLVDLEYNQLCKVENII